MKKFARYKLRERWLPFKVLKRSNSASRAPLTPTSLTKTSFVPIENQKQKNRNCLKYVLTCVPHICTKKSLCYHHFPFFLQTYKNESIFVNKPCKLYNLSSHALLKIVWV